MPVDRIPQVLRASARLLSRLFGETWRRPMMAVEELRRRLDAGDELSVVDVRTAADFDGEQGHLEVARNLPLEELAGRLDELGGDRTRTIAIVCRTDRRSAEAAALLRGRGFADVHVVRGGMTAWLQNDWPIDRGQRQPESPA